MKYHSTYKGFNIYINNIGYRLKYSTVNSFYAADTLAGIKQLITESKKIK